MNPEQFQAALAEKGIMLTNKQMDQFAIYLQVLVEWNNKINLTAITEAHEVYLKHFYDSITAAFFYDFTMEGLTVCDIGAGAGFPSIPLKICFPNIQVTIVDSLKKRIGFLEQLAMDLGITGVAFYHDRAETFAKGKAFREQFNVVMARAVARMSVLSELCLPLCEKGGTFIAMKASQTDEELKDAKRAIHILGGKVNHVHTFPLPVEHSERSIVIIDKLQTTPSKYPRKPGTPNKKPLV